VRQPPERERGPAATPGPARSAADTLQITGSIPDPYGIRRAARERVGQVDRHRRVCAELEQLASLVAYYCGPRRWAA
jgi:hypothetical protein